MSKYNASQDELDIVHALVEQNRGVRSIMKELGVGKTVATRLRDEVCSTLGIVPASLGLVGDVSQSHKGSDEQITNLYREALKEASRIRLSQPLGEVNWTPNESDMVGLCFLADVHMGTSGCDYEALERDIDLILNTPGMYCCVGGDLIDNHIKHLSAIVASEMSPGDQWNWLFDILERLKPKLVAIVSGNHENFLVAQSNFDPLKQYANLSAIPYDKDEAMINVSMGNDVNYKISVRHKYRYNSSLNASNSVKQMWTHGDHDFDVGVVCHNHIATCEPFVRHGVERWALRPGSYQVISDFARVHGFHGSQPITPAIILKGGTRDMHGFAKLDWACDMLNSNNSVTTKSPTPSKKSRKKSVKPVSTIRKLV